MYEIKIPKEIKVGGSDYTIKVDDVTLSYLKDHSNRGECSHRNRIIGLDNSQSPQDFSETFIHECCHAVDTIYCNDELSEWQIRGIASGLHQILEELGVRFVK